MSPALHATELLRALSDLSPDAAVVDALDLFARRAQSLSRSQLVRAALIAVDALGAARPEWTETEVKRAVLCALREVERIRAERRRSAA